jgi:hypothetical protein
MASMMAFDDTDPPEPRDSVPREAAYEMSRNLHELALRYWSQGRAEDARRVALQAADILRRIDPGSELMARITSTIEGVEHEAGAHPSG